MATRYYIDEEQWYAPKKKRSGALRAVLIFIVVLVLIAIIGCGGAYIMGWQMTGEPNPANWSIFKGDKNKSDKAVIAVTSDGVALTDGATCETGGGITYFMRSAGNTEYIPAGEITLTATLSNEFINGAFDWSVEWTNPAAEWANGKTAANYVSVTPTADGSASATLHFLAKFNEQIIVKAQLRGTESQDTSTVDCLKSATMSAPSLCFTDFDDPFDFEADVELSEGTVTGDFKIDRASVYLHNNFVNSVKNYLTFNIDIAPFGLANLSENSKSFTLLSDSYLTTQSTEYLTYAMFIANFDNYDQAHKDAIYYAWYRAWNDVQNNVLLDITISYNFQGVRISDFSESDYGGTGSYQFRITGSSYGSEIAPNVTLNKNVVFGRGNV